VAARQTGVHEWCSILPLIVTEQKYCDSLFCANGTDPATVIKKLPFHLSFLKLNFHFHEYNMKAG
jgi:hypothetical protein